MSVLPPVLAILLAIGTRQVYLSLGAGVWLGWTILEGWNPLRGMGRGIEETVAVLANADSAKVILFTLVIGAVIATIEWSGGVRGFVRYVEDRSWVTSARRAQALAWVVGFVVFIESNITVLVAGAAARPLFDRFRVSREKLAYLIDSTSAPVCILIPLNAWGAYNLGILGTLGVEDPLGVLVATIPFNFYAIAALLLAGFTVVRGLDLGPMKTAENRARQGVLHAPGASVMVDEATLSPEPTDRIAPRARNALVPIVTMVVCMPVALWITGGGDLREGSGATSVLWSVLAALGVAWGLILPKGGTSVDELIRTALRGAGGLVPLALILLLALALGNVASALGTGEYVATITSGVLPPPVFLPVAFVVSAGIAFSTGTSWGTFAIMLPIVVPVAVTLDAPIAPFTAAALSGGIFGDHASPISDTTIISSMAAVTDHIQHVRTQLPYALTAGLVAVVGFAIAGLVL